MSTVLTDLIPQQILQRADNSIFYCHLGLLHDALINIKCYLLLKQYETSLWHTLNCKCDFFLIPKLKISRICFVINLLQSHMTSDCCLRWQNKVKVIYTEKENIRESSVFNLCRKEQNHIRKMQKPHLSHTQPPPSLSLILCDISW